MPMDSVTNENVAKLKKERDETKAELEILVGTTLEQMWMKELDALEVEYSKYKKVREDLQKAEVKKAQVKKAKK